MDKNLKYYEPDNEVTERLTRALNCHPILASLLSARGINTAEEADRFLHPALDDLTEPFLIKDMTKAVERIYTAVMNKEKILIFGDFDADGVTSTALFSDFLEYCDADVSWYIPHRIKEGYSIQPEHIRMAVEQDIDLIITVDCGIGGHDAVFEASKEDIDVIITDHHEPESSLPDAVAVIDPKREDCPSGLSFLAGVGVAFYTVMALRKYFREKGFWEKLTEPNLLNYLDLFAIGTIGDMVPLIEENRTLCIAGLKKIKAGSRLGLRSLAQASRIDLSRLDSDDISFKIVPRINAAGRISHARICVTQLTSNDIITAEKTASVLDQLNQKRRTIEQDIVNEIEDRIQKAPQLIDTRLLFLWDDHWDPSVLGIAASKLSRKYTCPVILLSTSNTVAVGSCRSINDINIHQALKTQEDLLVRFGGHAMASGLTVEPANLEDLAAALTRHIESEYSIDHFQKQLTIDAVLDFDDITFDLASEINRLRPFGMANPEPVFLTRNIHVISSYTIGGSHRKMILSKQGSTGSHLIEAFQFNVSNPDEHPSFFPQIIFKLKINKFKPTAVQLIIEDY